MRYLLTTIAAALLCTAGCFEKQQDAGDRGSQAAEDRAGSLAGAEGAEPAGESGDGERPAEPANADDPDDPGDAPADGGAPAEGGEQPASPENGPPPAGEPPGHQTPFETTYADAPMVTITGTLLADDGVDGVVDIDCFAPREGGDKGRELVNKVKVQEPGAYTFKAPKDFGELYLEAFIDRDGDGPDDGDARGEYAGNPLVIGGEDLEGVDIELIQPAKSTGGGAWRGGGRRQNRTDE